MPFIQMGDEFAGNLEQEAVAEGHYDLIATDPALVQSSEKNHVVVILKHANPPIPNAMDIFHYLPLPKPDDSDKSRNAKNMFTKRFLHWFDVPYVEEKGQCGFNTDDIAGARASKIRVTQEMYIPKDGSPGRMQNSADLPPVPSDATTGKAAPSKRRRRA